MAGIMERIRLLVRSEAGDFAERHEDAEREINQTIADAMVQYTKLRHELDPLVESETQARERLEGLQDEARRWHRVAGKALLAGNEGDARTALSREQDLKARISAQEGIYQQIHETAHKMRTQLAEIEDGISQLQARVKHLKAKEAAAQATTVAVRVSSGSGALDRRERQAEWQLAEAEGLAEARRAQGQDPYEELRRAQEKAAGFVPVPVSGVDEALAALRAQLEVERDEDDD